MPIMKHRNQRILPGGLTPGGAAVVVGLVAVGVWLIVKGIQGTSLTLDGVGTAQDPTDLAAVRGPVGGGDPVLLQDAPETTKTAGPSICTGCDVVLITLCSLRKDHVGAYGLVDIETPHLDRVAQEGVRFERAYAASNFTLASLTAVLTGRFGSSTGVTGWNKGLTVDVPTLPEVLGHYGYATGGFTTDAPSGFREEYGLARGFQRLEITPPPPGTPDGRRVSQASPNPGAVVAPAASWLSRQDDGPVFMMLHSRTAHYPFVISAQGAKDDPTGITQLLFDAGNQDAGEPPEARAMPGMKGGTEQQGVVEISGSDPLQVQVAKVGESAVAMWKQRYHEAVTRMDSDMAAVWAALESRGRLDKTVLVVVADHGESLNDHGELLHGDAFYDGVINVPLMIRAPGVSSGESISALVSQVDIAPTILEMVGAMRPAGLDGQSMVPLLDGSKDKIRATTLSEGGVALHDASQLPGAVISPPWALLKQRRGCAGGPRIEDDGIPVCLYQMSDDPTQEHSVTSRNSEVVDMLLDRWAGFRKARAGAGHTLDLSPAFVEALQKTGYDFSTGVPQ